MNSQAENSLDKYLLKLSNIFEERSFNKLETNMLLIGTPQEHKKDDSNLKEQSKHD